MTYMLIDARKAARELGAPLEAVIEDIRAGMVGRLESLIGGPAGSWWLVDGYQLEEPHLSRHRKRFTDAGKEVRS